MPAFVRLFAALALTFLSAVLAPMALRAEDIRVHDIAGREVVLAAPARRIILGEGRHLAVLGMLTPDPVALVAGWRADKGLDPATLAAYRARFPALDGVAQVGAGGRNLSIEAILAARPDLVVLSMMDKNAPQADQVEAQLAAAGIALAYVDFFVDPLNNTLPSIDILAALIDVDGSARAKAKEFSDFYTPRLEHIRSTVANAPRPRVFVQVHAAPGDCCNTVGRAQFDGFIDAAGGENLGRSMVAGTMGNVGLENLLAADPDVFMATGGAHMAARGGLVLGPDVAAETAGASFAALLDKGAGLSVLRAVREGRSLGLWHLFNDSPAHIVAIEVIARALHPELFADLDPAATLAEFESRFSPVPMAGTFWVEGMAP